MGNNIFQRLRLQFKKFGHPQNAVWYLVIIIMLAITWSGVKAVQTNYGLQKQISTLKQENAVLQLQNDNAVLTNQYLGSSQYEDLAARQSLGLAAPGESVLLVPTSVAMKYVDTSITPKSVSTSATVSTKTPPRLVRNLEAWRDFLLGRTVISD